MATRKRSRNPPAHLKDYAQIKENLTVKDTNTEGMYQIVLDSNDKEYNVTLKELEIVGIPANEEDLDIGSKVVWMHRGRTGYAAEIIKLPDGDHKGPVPIVKKVLKKRSSKDSVSSDDDDDNNGNDGNLSPSLSPSKFKLQPKKIDLGSDASKSTEGTSKFTFSTPKSSVSTPNSSISGVYELPEGAPNNELLISIDKKLTQVLDYLRTGNLRIYSTSSSDSEVSKQVVSPRISPFPDTKDDDLAILKMPKKTPESFALSLMDTLFTDEEMKTHLFIKKKKSRSTKEELDRERVRKLFAHVTTEFGQEAVKSKFSSIVEKCNQKCRDKGKSSVKKKDEESALVESIINITNDNA